MVASPIDALNAFPSDMIDEVLEIIELSEGDIIVIEDRVALLLDARDIPPMTKAMLIGVLEHVVNFLSQP